MDKDLDFPLISIIMPAYNAEKFIDDSIKSVINQTYQNWELIIINDGSKDGTAKIVEEKIKLDKRIHLINQDNKKQAGARNAGLETIKGNWVAFLDADDIWLPAKLEIQLQYIEKSPADIYYSGGYIVDANLKITADYPTIYGWYNGSDMYKLLYKENSVPVLAVLLKADWVFKVGFQDETLVLVSCEDWDYWLRLCLLGATFYGIDEKLFYYRKHDNNMSSDGIKMQMAQAAVMLKNYDRKLDEDERIKVQLKNIINPLINRLINENRNNDALFLLNGMASVGSNLSYKLRMSLIKTLGKFSVYPIRILAKLDS